jgi:hypothetical protein
MLSPHHGRSHLPKRTLSQRQRRIIQELLRPLTATGGIRSSSFLFSPV